MNDSKAFPDDPALNMANGLASRAVAVWRAVEFLFLSALFIGVSTLICAAALKLHAQTGPDGRATIAEISSNPTIATVLTAASLLGVVLASAITCARGRLRARDVGFDLTHLRRNAWIGAGLGLGLLTSIVLGLIGLGNLRLTAFDVHGLEAPLWFAGFVLFFVMVGLNEELMLRGPLLTLLSRAFGFWPAAILSSLIFMSMHAPNTGETPIGLMNVFLVGLTLAWTRRRTGSLSFAIGFHAAWDFAQSYLFGVADSGAVFDGAIVRAVISGPSWLSGGATGPEGGVLCTLSMALLVFFVNALWPRPKRSRGSYVDAAI